MTKHDKKMVKKGLFWILIIAVIWHIIALHNELNYYKNWLDKMTDDVVKYENN